VKKKTQKRSPRNSPPLAVVVNTSPDTVDLLRVVLSQAGFAVMSEFTFNIRDGRVNFGEFLRRHKPDVIVYDIAPPYEQNYLLFQHLCSVGEIRTTPVVLTTTNAAQIRQFIGRNVQVYEVVGKPYDLNRIVQAVREASRSRLTRQA